MSREEKKRRSLTFSLQKVLWITLHSSSIALQHFLRFESNQNVPFVVRPRALVRPTIYAVCQSKIKVFWYHKGKKEMGNVELVRFSDGLGLTTLIQTERSRLLIPLKSIKY